MPISPNTAPIHLQCPHCGWRTTWKATSDALVLPPTTCPRCDNDLVVAARIIGGAFAALLKNQISALTKAFRY